MPIWGRARGWASGSLYSSESRELVASLTAETYLSGFTTLYTFTEDEPRAYSTVRAMAMRDLVEKLAQRVCEDGGR